MRETSLFFYFSAFIHNKNPPRELPNRGGNRSHAFARHFSSIYIHPAGLPVIMD